MRGPAAQLQRYADGLGTGLLSVPEVASAALDVLADAPDRAGLWAGAAAALREPVLAYLAGVGLDGLPPVFRFGPTDPAWRVAQAARRREVAAALLADAEPGAAADTGGVTGSRDS